jgi:regulatory protein
MEQQADKLMEENDKVLFEKAYQSALNILDRANQTEKTLYDKLIKKEYPKEISGRIVKKLVSLNLINDEEYAKNHIEYFLLRKYFGYKKIFFKLKTKGIDKEIVKKYYDFFMENVEGGEEEIIKNYILKNIKTIKKLYQKNELHKIRYKIFSCGFSSYAVSCVMKELNSLID